MPLGADDLVGSGRPTSQLQLLSYSSAAVVMLPFKLLLLPVLIWACERRLRPFGDLAKSLQTHLRTLDTPPMAGYTRTRTTWNRTVLGTWIPPKL
jgi:hypothetical protein